MLNRGRFRNRHVETLRIDATEVAVPARSPDIRANASCFSRSDASPNPSTVLAMGIPAHYVPNSEVGPAPPREVGPPAILNEQAAAATAARTAPLVFHIGAEIDLVPRPSQFSRA